MLCVAKTAEEFRMANCTYELVSKQKLNPVYELHENQWSTDVFVSPPLSNCISFSSSMSTAWAIGTIIAVVAVLLIHIDRKAVTDMKPNINLLNDTNKEANKKRSNIDTKLTYQNELIG